MTRVLIEKDVMVPMRDGVRLATDVLRVDSAGPQPVLLARTPYGKDGHGPTGAGRAEYGIRREQLAQHCRVGIIRWGCHGRDGGRIGPVGDRAGGC